MSLWSQLIVAILISVWAESKTIRSRIYTNENGLKELVWGGSSDVKPQDIDLLLKILNSINVTTDGLTVRSVEEDTPGRNSTGAVQEIEKAGKISENILMKHWNTLTEVGWKNIGELDKKMNLSNTRTLDLKSEFNYDDSDENSEGYLNGTDLTVTDTTELTSRIDDEPIPLSEEDLCQEVLNLCGSGQSQSNLTTCLAAHNQTLLDLVEHVQETGRNLSCLANLGKERGARLGRTKARATPATTSSSLLSRTFLRPRIILHKILLPLLVLIVIKYLITLPFVAVSVFTLNAMWLGLLSLGAVLFKAKHRPPVYHEHHKVPIRRFNPLHASELYDPSEAFPQTEILWSPIRVPITASTIAS